MSRYEDIENLADACLIAHQAAQESGTPVARELARLLLFEVGRQLAVASEAEDEGEPTVPGRDRGQSMSERHPRPN